MTKENFNDNLSKARKCIECSFGILRAKWRLFGKDIELVQKNIPIIKCMCILHIIIREKDSDNNLNYRNIMLNIQNNWNDNNLNQRSRATNILQRAKEVRNVFVDYFLNN